MQSIWSVPQAAPMSTKANSSNRKRANFSEMMKEIFMTKDAPRTSRAAMSNPYFAQPAFGGYAQEAPAQNFFSQSAFSMKKTDAKKKGGMLLFLLPMVFAFLGIPFYLMAILKFIGMFQ